METQLTPSPLAAGERVGVSGSAVVMLNIIVSRDYLRVPSRECERDEAGASVDHFLGVR